MNTLSRTLLHPLLRRVERTQLEVHRETARLFERNAFLFADVRLQQLRANPSLRLRDWELRVFSQWGQDGILQYLIDRVPIPNRTFIEFGVQDYQESTTRFLLMHDNWSGLIIDGDSRNLESIQKQDYYWQFDLTALDAFVTRENINELIRRRFSGDVGLLVIDIDGNDYWIWDAIDVVQPRIVVCEYNSVFGNQRAVTVPYRPDFTRGAAHDSNLYFGASVPALCQLAARKGYTFVGCNSHGNDAFFVRTDVAQNVPAASIGEGYVCSKFRESRGPEGELTYLSGADRLKPISHLDVIDLAENQTRKIGDLALAAS